MGTVLTCTWETRSWAGGNGINVLATPPVRTENLICMLVLWLQLSNISLHIYDMQCLHAIKAWLPCLLTHSHTLRSKDQQTRAHKSNSLNTVSTNNNAKILESLWGLVTLSGQLSVQYFFMCSICLVSMALKSLVFQNCSHKITDVPILFSLDSLPA